MAARVSARERFLAGMDTHVRLQVEIKRELLAALLALIWLFPSVYKHVTLELSVVQEALLAARVSALEELVAVDCHVLLERGSVTEDFAAGGKVALERLAVSRRKLPGLLGIEAADSLAQQRLAIDQLRHIGFAAIL